MVVFNPEHCNRIQAGDNVAYFLESATMAASGKSLVDSQNVAKATTNTPKPMTLSVNWKARHIPG